VFGEPFLSLTLVDFDLSIGFGLNQIPLLLNRSASLVSQSNQDSLDGLVATLNLAWLSAHTLDPNKQVDRSRLSSSLCFDFALVV
jgi:hypothetical protein